MGDHLLHFFLLLFTYLFIYLFIYTTFNSKLHTPLQQYATYNTNPYSTYCLLIWKKTKKQYTAKFL